MAGNDWVTDHGEASRSERLPTLASLPARLAARGAMPALIEIGAEERRELSYGELAAAVNHLAGELEALGLKPGERVGLLAENRLEWVVAALAVMAAGGVVMPLDVQIDQAALAHVLADSQAPFFFTSAAQQPRFAELPAARRPRLLPLEEVTTDRPVVDETLGREPGGSAENTRPGDDPAPDNELRPAEQSGAAARLRPSDPAALFYTSGTTGTPKGVPLSHANLLFQLEAVAAMGLVCPSDRVLLPLPFHHVYPLVIGLLVPLGLGLPLILPDAPTGPRILRALKEGEATVIIGVPRLYQAVVDGIVAKAEAGGLGGRLYFRGALALASFCWRRLGVRSGRLLLAPLHRKIGANLRLLASGGSALDPELAHQLNALGWQVAIGYGLTETAPLLTINPPTGPAASVGRPLPGVEVRIAPPPAAEGAAAATASPTEVVGPAAGGLPPAAAGQQPGAGVAASQASEPAAMVRGEVLVRGPGVFAGYRKLPEQTAAAFSSDGWFRTGDLGWFDHHGYLYLAGRASTLIVTAGGKNIQPEPLEEALAAHPYIGEAGVLQDRQRLAVLLVPDLAALRRAGEHDIEAALRQALLAQSRRLASYQRPDAFAVSREALPRTRLGKIRRHLLAERYRRARQPESGRGLPLAPHEMSDHDRALLEVPVARRVWEWLARRYPEVRLTPDTSPHLDLGVDSLEWLNLATEIGRQAKVELSEEVIGRIETVRDLLSEVAHLNQLAAEYRPPDPLVEPEVVLAADQRRWLAPLRGWQVGLAWLLYQLNRGIVRGIFRLEVRGLAQLPAAGPLLFTPNHVSFIDPFVLAAALPFNTLRRTRFAGLDEVAFANPLFRAVCRLAQAVPIDPRRATASSLAFGALVLQRGENLVWFPEGERSLSGRLLAFRPGVGMLLARRQVPAVPVAIRGAYQVLPRGRNWPRWHRLAIEFGPPLTPEQLLPTAPVPAAGTAPLPSDAEEAPNAVAVGHSGGATAPASAAPEATSDPERIAAALQRRVAALLATE